MGKRNKLKLFRESYLWSKEQVLYSLEKYLDHCKSNYADEENWSRERTKKIISLCESFRTDITNLDFPVLDQWWFYSYRLTNSSFILEMCHCDEIEFDTKGFPEIMGVGSSFTLLETKCELLTITEYAKLHHVRAATVLQWIKKAKLRSAIKLRNEWFIPEIAEKPRRKYEDVTYIWDNHLEKLEDKYNFLKGQTSAHIYQDKIDKKIFHVVLRHLAMESPYCIDMTTDDRINFEIDLLSQSCVTAEELSAGIMYVPCKKRIDIANADYEKFISRSYTAKQSNSFMAIDYGPVIVTKGPLKGRIGYYDCESDESSSKGIVFFGDMLLTNTYYEIKYSQLSSDISTIYMLQRSEELRRELAQIQDMFTRHDRRVSLLLELQYIDNLIFERYINAMYLKSDSKTQIFISHATKDLPFSRCLATDLSESGYTVFLDDWSIDFGENIISRINDELEASKILIPIISHNFLSSVFCRDEWTSFYIKFAKENRDSILPVILDDSDAPAILSAIKYARCRDGSEYQTYLPKLLNALKKKENHSAC